ncbi:hypothetical protein SA496_22190 [Pseudomonas sp. JS3066]|jgi:hypothetical protein|uniref:hypothetical protein n=1 Tax=unclassified Pseudomonas TaxID=196821 RepID=UPI00129EA219|nr:MULTISPECIES: hypothetical protein [unclassified Pseudomonas]WVK92395.1 hypothetical protein SA496_22190 [Pseudomonas sp. JS3066]
MHTHIDPNPPRKPRKPNSKHSPRIKTPGELLHKRAEEANEAARVPQDDELAPHQGPTP